MKKILSLAIALTLVVNFAFAQKEKEKKITSGPLDNKTFVVDITKDGKKKAEPLKDEMKFKGGKLAIKMLTDMSYKSGTYEGTVDSTSNPKTCAFTMEAKDDSENTFKWEGTVTYGETTTIEGTSAILNKKGKQKESYTFTGELKGKKAPAKKEK